MNRPTENELMEWGTKITNAMLRFLPKGITWIDDFKGDERGAKIAAGRAAWDACLPIIAGEALREIGDDEFKPVLVSLNKGFGCRNAFNLLMENRLADMTAKPDPAVEAVRKILYTKCLSGAREEMIAEIVAAVDDARKK